MSPIDVLLVFLAFYPVVTGAAWMVGGVIFRLTEERPRAVDPPGGLSGVTVIVPAYNEGMRPGRVRRILRSPRYAAIAGCPRVTNRGSVIATMQMLETASLIGLIRRTHALAGRVGTVAGVLGLFRRDAVLAVGGYDPRMATEDIELTWRLLQAGHLTGFAPNALVGMQVPETLSGIWAQRTRWARGQGEVLRTHARTVARPKHAVMWPIAIEALLSYLWVGCMLIAMVYAFVRWAVAPEDARFGAMLAWGVGIAVIAMLQIVVAVLVDLRLDPRLPYACLLLPLYPLAYWTINALAALTAQTPGLLSGPRDRRVVWDLPRSDT